MNLQSSPINFQEHRAELLQPKVEIKIVTASRLSKKGSRETRTISWPPLSYICVRILKTSS